MNLPRPILVVVFTVIVMGGWAVEAHAQSRTTSALRGTVVSTDGTPLVDAAVRLRHEPTGAERVAGTNEQGRFLFTLLPPGGPYTLTVQTLGYSQFGREDIRLQVGETYSMEITMAVQAIEVEGISVDVNRAEIFNPGQVGPATLLPERIVESVPILSRNIMELAILSPLVKTTESGGFSVAGQNDRYNSILIDGVLSKDVFGLTAGGVPGGQAGAKLIPIDAVAQYEVLIAPFDVRLSGFTGGVMNAVTKSGTNEWRTRFFGVHRTEALIGDLTLPTGSVEASGVDRSVLGFSLGGPLIRDEAHFFVSAEFEERKQPPSGYNLTRDDPLLVRISEESVGQIGEILENDFGLDAGDPGPYSLGQELANVFARVDWHFGSHRLTVRNIFAHATNDESPNRAFFEPYELSSNAVNRSATNNTTSLQLFSDFGSRGGNELTINVQRTTDQSDPVTSWPQVEVDATSSIQGAAYAREVRAGSQFFAQDNDLAQTSFRLTNALTLLRGSSSYTLGVTGAYHTVDHRYLPGATGSYFFASLNDLVNHAPQRYQRTVLREGQDPTVSFSVAELGLFVQNEIAAGKGLTMRFGLRADVPYALDKPQVNYEILDFFGYRTSDVPSGGILLSPRWGFNWQTDEENTTQVRGGVGMFVGQLPYVWLSNAFHNNGLRSLTYYCEGRITDDPVPGQAAPEFDPSTTPTGCTTFSNATGLWRETPFRELNAITFFRDDFKYPQDLKFSVAVDHEFSSRLNMSLGVLFNKTLNQVVLEEVNLDGPSGSAGNVAPYGGFERKYYGSPSSTGFTPNRENNDFDQVLMVRNESEDWGFSLTGELRGNLTERLAFQTGYSFSRTWDRMSLTSTDMISNFGFNATGGDPNRARLTTSNFDRPHKIVAAVYGSPFPNLDNTEVSLLYTGQSGLPYSYVYRGDINGDGYPGLGQAFDRTNDLVYVPKTPGELPAGIATIQLLGHAMENDECLSKYKGQILPRNGCRAPWQNRLDLRISHSVPMGSAMVRFEGDLINMLNLVNSSWGTIQSIRPIVSLLEPYARDEQNLFSRWAGGAVRTEEGTLESTQPWFVVTPDSQWQAQFGVRVTFGGAR